MLTEEEFVRLAEELGGDRIYIPLTPAEDSDLVRAIGHDAAERICEAMPCAWFPVPLARRERALHYQALGFKDHQIARKIGMTRSGVSRLLDREAIAATKRK